MSLESINARWLNVRNCPACGSPDSVSQGQLTGNSYHFADEAIPFPDKGIALAQCDKCGLIYKTVVPSPSFLSEVFSRQAGKVWVSTYSFKNEVRLIQDLVDKDFFDLLDIGPSNGDLLRACARLGGRRSGLDVIRHPGLKSSLRGEFIQGLLDDPVLRWSKQPYDLVTAFDVFEHFYYPSQAFKNLRTLVKKNGFVLLETGAVDSYWPQKFGASSWWYAGLFEHHLFWSEKTLRKIADKFGFELLSIARKRHKSRKRVSFGYGTEILKVALYEFSRRKYESISTVLGKQGGQPWSPFTRDHFRAVLKKK